MNARICLLLGCLVGLAGGVFFMPSQGGAYAGAESVMVRSDHPRLGLLPEGTAGARTFSEVRRLFKEDETFRSYFLPAVALAEKELQEQKPAQYDPLLQAACWVATGEERFAQAGRAALEQAELKSTAQSDYYSPVWQFALAYDWLAARPDMTEAPRRAIEKKIADVLASEVEALDNGTTVVWHGRTQLTNNSLVTALALSLDPRARDFQRRTIVHYEDAVRALELAEGWPEGTGYWIHNRAFPFALAADCYQTATGQTRIGEFDVREGIRRVGLWQLYSLQPDYRFARFGDCWEDGLQSGPGLWQPVVDYYARVTQDPDLTAISDYFRAHSRRHYNSGQYGWSVVLTYDPQLPMPADYTRTEPERYLNAHLPQSRLCGRRTLGEAFFTTGWGNPDALWIGFKAGQAMAHHGHYDQGSFSISYGSPLAVHSGHYADYFSQYRVGYFVQTISKNSLLIQAPNEFSNWLRDQKGFDAITGGQRVIMPTGSSIMSVQDWFNNVDAGRHYGASEITRYDSIPGVFDYVSADITKAYNSTIFTEKNNPAKVSSVVRRFLYLREPQVVLILDRITTTKPDYRVQWLLHTPAKPQSETEEVREGTADNGILTTPDRWLQMMYGKGRLSCQLLLPQHAELLKIGGTNYDHYLQTAAGGVNPEPSGEGRQEREEYGRWRLQWEDTAQQTAHTFLTALFPRLIETPVPAPAKLLAYEDPTAIVSVGDCIVLFAKPAGSYTYTAPVGTKRHVLVEVPIRTLWEVKTAEGIMTVPSSAEGVLTFTAGAGAVTITPTSEHGGGGYQ